MKKLLIGLLIFVVSFLIGRIVHAADFQFDWTDPNLREDGTMYVPETGAKTQIYEVVDSAPVLVAEVSWPAATYTLTVSDGKQGNYFMRHVDSGGIPSGNSNIVFADGTQSLPPVTVMAPPGAPVLSVTVTFN